MNCIADDFARLCRERGIASTRSEEAKRLALKMAIEAYGDDNLGKLLSCVDGVLSGVRDLTWGRHTDDERQATVEACVLMAEEIDYWGQCLAKQMEQKI